ncbi:tRNA lysidine(34) synthetase TilS [bacterium]|nr:tRNA lysidine(34) synthetase TilS [bacterium]
MSVPRKIAAHGIPKFDPLINAVRQTVVTRGLFEGARRVLVAVSGGLDSMSLLAALRVIAPQWKLDLAVAHVDHGIHENAADHAQFVEQHSAAIGLPFFVRRLKVRARRGESLEEAARDARHAALRDMADEGGADRVATAHHLDDQAETVLYRALRGAGTSGLAGIRPLAPPFARPFLDVRRVDIESFAARHAIEFVTDPTNADIRFVRNAIRREAMPILERIMPGTSRSLARLADIARDEGDLLAAIGDDAAREIAVVADGEVRIAIKAYRNLDPKRARLALRSLLSGLGDIWSLARIENLDRHLRSDSAGKGARFGSELSIHRVTGEFVIKKVR